VLPKKKKKKNTYIKSSWEPVAHTCNPSYSEGRDQEANAGRQFKRPYLKNTHHKKRVNGMVQGVDIGPEFKLQYQKKKLSRNNVLVKETVYRCH
jgi:hypothetical protein